MKGIKYTTNKTVQAPMKFNFLTTFRKTASRLHPKSQMQRHCRLGLGSKYTWEKTRNLYYCQV